MNVYLHTYFISLGVCVRCRSEVAVAKDGLVRDLHPQPLLHLRPRGRHPPGGGRVRVGVRGRVGGVQVTSVLRVLAHVLRDDVEVVPGQLLGVVRPPHGCVL